MGTPSYMAPEQAAGKTKEIGPAADVYSLGAILYELLTGRPPFLAESWEATRQLVLSEEPIPPCRLQPKLPRDLQTICLKCLEKEPSRRYQNAAYLAQDLRRSLNCQPILARRVRSWERAWKWCMRRPAVSGLLLALLTILVGGGLVMTRFWLAADEAKRRHAELLKILEGFSPEQQRTLKQFSEFLRQNPYLLDKSIVEAMAVFKKENPGANSDIILVPEISNYTTPEIAHLLPSEMVQLKGVNMIGD
jgi:hypothetical protein